MNIQMKRCTRCGEQFPATAKHFKPFKRWHPDGLVSICRRCQTSPSTNYCATPPSGMKFCAKCQDMKPATPDYFKRDKTRPDGLFPYCKTCTRLQSKSITPEERERNRQRSLAYASAHREEARLRAKQWHWNNRDYVLSYQRANRTNAASWRRTYRAHNPLVHKVSNNRRRARKLELPDTLTKVQWQRTLEHFGHTCAVCGRPEGLWHRLAIDHWIPLSSPDCPGTTVDNVVPLCHGIDGCNNSKGDTDPAIWLERRYGTKKARKILARINDYLASTEPT